MDAGGKRLHLRAPQVNRKPNLGFGEVGVYGSVRGVPTPRIDALGS